MYINQLEKAFKKLILAEDNSGLITDICPNLKKAPWNSIFIHPCMDTTYNLFLLHNIFDFLSQYIVYKCLVQTNFIDSSIMTFIKKKDVCAGIQTIFYMSLLLR